MLLGVFIISCNESEYRVVEVKNPAFIKNTAFNFSEDLSSPKFKKLINKYQLDIILHDEEDYFKNNTWIWGGNPHWAYEKPEFMIRELKREAIYWTPNTIKTKVSIDGQVAHIELISDTPNLKEYTRRSGLPGL